jgi:hypothetical protein
MGESLAGPVLLGLGVGIAFLVLIALFLGPQRQFGNAAIKIALQNSTLQEIFEGEEQVISYYDDWSPPGRDYDCPIKRCALIVFFDKAEPDDLTKYTARVFVNMNSRNVVAIIASDEYLVAKANETREAKLFLSRYPDADIQVNPGKRSSLVYYNAITPSHRLDLLVFTTTSGVVTEVTAACEGHDGSYQQVTSDVLELHQDHCLCVGQWQRLASTDAGRSILSKAAF